MPTQTEFPTKMADVVNHAMLGLMISIGHRTGLFDQMAGQVPSTSAQIALRAGLHERYVREWLASMVVGGIITFDEKNGVYQLPKHAADCLTRAAGSGNAAIMMQQIAVLGSVEDLIVAGFKSGEGVPYSAYPRFQEVLADESGEQLFKMMRSDIFPKIEGLDESLRRGIDVIDVGCGSGKILCAMAAQYRNSRFRGIDMSASAIAAARQHAQGMSNISFDILDAMDALNQRYQLILTFDAIHDQGNPQGVLEKIRSALTPDGMYLMQEIAGTGDLHQDMAHPYASFLYCISAMHCMPVSLAQGGPGLGAMFGQKQALQMLEQAGFSQVAVHRAPDDVFNMYYACRI